MSVGQVSRILGEPFCPLWASVPVGGLRGRDQSKAACGVSCVYTCGLVCVHMRVFV